MDIIDISRPISPETAVWPGDTPFSLAWVLRRDRGDSVNLAALTISPHTGTHADAPLHVCDGASAIDRVDLAAYVGPARVVAVAPGPDALVHPAALGGLTLADPPRLLLKTGTVPDAERFPRRFAALAPETADMLVAGGVRLVGLDTPSLDPPESKTLPAHNRLVRGAVLWLENLDLSAVEPGEYELIALPLRLVGGCASPVRAVLRALGRATEGSAARADR